MKILDAMHHELIREHGGSHGVRDRNLLDSALARPRHRWSYGEADLPVVTAAYGFGLAKNHGYVDGNKRVAYMAMFVFLYLNGLDLIASEPDAVVTMTDVASGELSEEELAVWIRTNTRPLS
jgi:death-on-curing protein